MTFSEKIENENSAKNETILFRCSREEIEVVESCAKKEGFERLKNGKREPDRSKAIRKIIHEWTTLTEEKALWKKLTLPKQQRTMTNGGKPRKKTKRKECSGGPSFGMGSSESYSMIDDPYGAYR